MKCAKLTKNKTVEEIVDLEKCPRGYVNLDKYPIPQKLIVPEWGGVKVGWIECEVDEDLSPRKKYLIDHVNVLTSNLINSFLPIWDQIDYLRKGEVDHEDFKRRDAIVAKCREIKDKIMAAKSEEEINKISLELE